MLEMKKMLSFTASIPDANELVCASMVTLRRDVCPGTSAAAPLTKMGPLL